MPKTRKKPTGDPPHDAKIKNARGVDLAAESRKNYLNTYRIINTGDPARENQKAPVGIQLLAVQGDQNIVEERRRYRNKMLAAREARELIVTGENESETTNILHDESKDI